MAGKHSGEWRQVAVQINKYRVSKHAARRMAQRNLSAHDVELALRLGHQEYRTGAQFFFLGRRDFPREAEKELARLTGTVVVVEADAVIATVYRNHRALAKIKRKSKHCLKGVCR
jgi:hypothetical protein